MEQMEKYSISELLHELLLRIDNDPETFVHCLRGYGLEDISKIKKILTKYYCKETITATCNDYEGSIYPKYYLENTDCRNTCNCLIICSPTANLSRFRLKDLGNVTIYEAKHLLSRVKFNNSSTVYENALIAKLRYFGNGDIIKIRDAINFYEEQVLRQAGETDELERNLFTLNADIKREIVSDDYSSIVDYFIDNAELCVWGALNKSSKEKLIRSKHLKSGESIKIRNNLTSIVSNYVTLQEANEGLVKQKTLDRFIIKKND